MIDLSIKEFLGKLGSAAPVPGGGGAAAALAFAHITGGIAGHGAHSFGFSAAGRRRSS